MSVSEFSDQFLRVVDAATAEYAPGDPVSPAVLLAQRAEFEAASGLSDGQYAVNPYGYPAMPLPSPDGVGRLPAGLVPEWAGHPIFWFDEATTARRPGETDAVWCVRMWLELGARGWVDLVEWEWFDVLLHGDIDVTDTDDRERIVEYQRTGKDPDIRGFRVDAVRIADPYAPARFADDLAAKLDPVLAAYEASAQEWLLLQTEEALTRLLSVDFDRDAAPLTESLISYRAAVANGGDRRSTWEAVRADAAALSDLVDGLSGAAFTITTPVLGAAARDTNDYMSQMLAVAGELQEQENARHEQLESLLAALRSDGTGDDDYRSLMTAFRQWHADAYDLGMRAARELDRVDRSGRWEPAPDAKVVPIEAAERRVRPADPSPTPRLERRDPPPMPAIHSGPATRPLRPKSAGALFDTSDIKGGD